MSKKNIFALDKNLLLLIATLLLLGLLLLYDATVVLAQDLYDNPYRFVFLQLSWALVGSVGFYFFSTIELGNLKRLATPIFIISVGLLGVLALFGILPCNLNFIWAPCINGANRWFYLNPPPFPKIPLLGVLGFQPSEFMKFSIILFLATKLEASVKLRQNVFKSYLFIVGLVSFLILLQPNMSTAALIFMIGTVVFVATGESLKQLIMAVPVFSVLAVGFILSSSYRRNRVLTFLFAGASSSGDLSTGYHIKQVLIALGSGGLLGLGLGQSRQKFQYLPEVFADSIFAIIGEELGFIGTVLVVLLFSALIQRGFLIAKSSHSLFNKLLATGVTTWIGLQFFINVGAMTKIIPLTGMPLPLISYGGSSLVFMLMGLGVLANVSRDLST